MNPNTHQDVLVKVTGPDRPGITHALMSIIAKNEEEITDIGQSVTHGLLSLSFVLRIPPHKNESESALKDLLFEANNLGLRLEYQVVEQLVESEQKNLTSFGEKYILNCVAGVVTKKAIGPQFIADIAGILAQHGLNILRIDRVSPNGEFVGLEITALGPSGRDIDYKLVKNNLLSASNTHQVDVAFQKDSIFRRSKRLIVFDMDSTLIQTEVIDEMAQILGIGPDVKKITVEAMNGELNFDESLKKRVSLLKGMTLAQMEEVLENLHLTPGVEQFIATLKELGYKIALISGGFTYFTDALKKRLGLDYAFANNLEIEAGVLTGSLEGPIVNADQKAFLLRLIAQQENIHLEQVVAIGDGANDLPMLSAAGLGIAFHAKEIVKRQASHHLSFGTMDSILYFLGINNTRNKLLNKL